MIPTFSAFSVAEMTASPKYTEKYNSVNDRRYVTQGYALVTLRRWRAQKGRLRRCLSQFNRVRQINAGRAGGAEGEALDRKNRTVNSKINAGTKAKDMDFLQDHFLACSGTMSTCSVIGGMTHLRYVVRLSKYKWTRFRIFLKFDCAMYLSGHNLQV